MCISTKQLSCNCNAFLLRIFFSLFVDACLNMSSTKPTDTNAARTALRINFSQIIESSIDPFGLARKLFTAKLLPEDICFKAMDENTGMTSERRMSLILTSLHKAVKINVTVFDTFLVILREVGGEFVGESLAGSLIKDYEGIILLDTIVTSNIISMQ